MCCMSSDVYLCCVSVLAVDDLCVSADVVGNLEGCRSDLLNVLQLYALGQLYQCHTAIHPINVKDRKIRNDSADTPDSCLR